MIMRVPGRFKLLLIINLSVGMLPVSGQINRNVDPISLSDLSGKNVIAKILSSDQIESTFFLSNNHEPSGLALVGQTVLDAPKSTKTNLFYVNDANGWVTSQFYFLQPELRSTDGIVSTANTKEWSKIQENYQVGADILNTRLNNLVSTDFGRELGKAFKATDIEGLALCYHQGYKRNEVHLYFINERLRGIYRMKLAMEGTGISIYGDDNISFIRPIWEPKDQELTKNADGKYTGIINDLLAGGANAGFEGIAVDCRQKRNRQTKRLENTVYVAKERDGRKIYRFTVGVTKWDTLVTQPLSMWKAIETQASVAYEKTMAQFNASPAASKLKLNNDYADLYFFNGHLYALERNAYEITKINPKTGQVVGRLYFGDLAVNGSPLQTYYDLNEPFGLAEGLAIDGKFLYLAFDAGEAASRVPAGKKGALFLKIRKPAWF